MLARQKITMDRPDRAPKFPLEEKLKAVCKQHGGMVSLGDYAVVDTRLYKVIER